MNQRKMKHTTGLAILAAALFAVPAVASAHGGKEGKRCKGERFAAMKAKYDTNGDGVLDQEEKAAMRADLRAQALAKYDANGDGRLDREERRKMRMDRMADRFQSLDANGDGVITREEAEGACGFLSRRFDEVDTNGDGVVSWAEYAAAKEKKHAKKGKRWKGKRGDGKRSR